ncbi:hypothetical protein DASC09_060200 [Saccharomycopsis crataegensis]|uniref:GH18 domain-containing protein n=1 Tax=Saccharomycopsis crataegensis TaxID=43959 RepID=A0AAV5QVE8_9ASCO|nr:hypothetical protein DASC09_060200 [Saccharomycopsis crataegensis]
MKFHQQLISIGLTLLLLVQTSAATKMYSKDGKNVAAYWGQGDNQESLATYCKQKNMGIVIISFLNNWNSTAVSYNFGNACGGNTCPQIEKDIKTCQKLGIKVFLSLGGDATLGSYGVSTAEEGRAAASVIYNTFHPKADPSVTKPFGKAEIDGFDYDIENSNSGGLGAMVAELRTLWTSKTLLISATPQCPYPDKGTSALLTDTSAKVDFVFVQFYNNPDCALSNDNGFNSSWGTWSNFTKNGSGNPNKMKIFIGVCTACDSEYIVDIRDVESRTAEMRNFEYFGGFTLWEVSSATKKITNGLNYISGLQRIIKNKKLPVAKTVNKVVVFNEDVDDTNNTGLYTDDIISTSFYTDDVATNTADDSTYSTADVYTDDSDAATTSSDDGSYSTSEVYSDAVVVVSSTSIQSNLTHVYDKRNRFNPATTLQELTISRRQTIVQPTGSSKNRRLSPRHAITLSP